MPNRYRIMNRITNQWWEGEANSAQEACQLAGWPIGDCWVRQYSPKGAGGWKNPDDAPELGRRDKKCYRCRRPISLEGYRRLDGLCQDCHDLIKYSSIIPKAPPNRSMTNPEAIALTQKQEMGILIE